MTGKHGENDSPAKSAGAAPPEGEARRTLLLDLDVLHSFAQMGNLAALQPGWVSALARHASIALRAAAEAPSPQQPECDCGAVFPDGKHRRLRADGSLLHLHSCPMRAAPSVEGLEALVREFMDVAERYRCSSGGDLAAEQQMIQLRDELAARLRGGA